MERFALFMLAMASPMAVVAKPDLDRVTKAFAAGDFTRAESLANEMEASAGAPAQKEFAAWLAKASAAMAAEETSGIIKEFKGHRYSAVEMGPVTWKEAKEACESLGGHLAICESQDENTYLLTQFVNSHPARYAYFYLGSEKSDSSGAQKWLNGVPVQGGEFYDEKANGKGFMSVMKYRGRAAWSNVTLNLDPNAKYFPLIEWDKAGKASSGPATADFGGEWLNSADAPDDDGYESLVNASRKEWQDLVRPCQTTIVDLNFKYGKAIEKEMQAVSKTGNLEELAALNEEKKAVTPDTPIVFPAVKAPPQSLKAIRGIYDREIRKINDQVKVLRKQAMQAHVQKLAKLESELIRAVKVEEAQAVRKIKDALTKELSGS